VQNVPEAAGSRHETLDIDAFMSLKAFEDRIQEIGQISSAKDAFATFEYFYRNLDAFRTRSGEDLIKTISEYSRTSPGDRLGPSPLNEAAVVLLSAYLEGFIEDLHKEATFHLLEEKSGTPGVLDALVKYAHERFANPRADRITSLFRTLTIKNVVANLKPDVKVSEINRFVDVRNSIAHGKHVRVESQDLKVWGLMVMKLAQGLTREVVKEINRRNQLAH
jgi:hypothetical protein